VESHAAVSGMPRGPGRAGGVDYGLLEKLTGYAVRRAQLVITEAFDAAMAGEGLTTQRFSALVLIARNPGLSQAELARVMRISPPQTTVVVDALVERGLVERRAQDGDRRARRLFVTQLAEQRLPQIEAKVVSHDDRVMAGLSAVERKELRRLLGAVVKTQGELDRG